MDAERTCLVVVLCLIFLTLEIQAQKKGFRGGSKSYEIHVEANTMGTNLHYELPESKVKATSKEDWQVDNDNAEMLAINSPILATVNVKHPKFSMKGQWPEYKTSFKLPKDVSVASKRADFSKLFKIKSKVRKTDRDQGDEESSGNGKASRNPRADEKPSGSGIKLKNLAGRLFSGRKSGKKKLFDKGVDMSQITRLLLPITGMKKVNLSNPRISSAMKGVIKHARKVVDEAKAVLNDAANFVTKVRKLVKVTKDHSKIHRQLHKVIAMETSSTKQTESNLNSVTPNAETLSLTSKDREKTESPRPKEVEGSEGRQNELNHSKASMQRTVHEHAHNDKAKTPGRKENKARPGKIAIGVEKRSPLDFKDRADPRKLERKPRVHRRGLAETLESILSTINDLQGLLKY